MANELSSLSVPAGSRTRKFRVGRGLGSGNGKTAGRGTKGQNSRSGARLTPGFEGGQMPIQRRLPKRGFRNAFAVEWDVVNVSQLSALGGSVIDPDVLEQKGLVSGSRKIKILGDGEVTGALNVKANAFSQQAKAKIEAAGGTVEVL